MICAALCFAALLATAKATGAVDSPLPPGGSVLPALTEVRLIVGRGPGGAPGSVVRSKPKPALGRFVFATPAGSLYTMGRDGKRLRQLTSRGDREPRWSPDGTRIAFARLRGLNRTAAQVMVINANGSGVRELARGAFGPAWSPNGRSLVIWSRIVATRSRSASLTKPAQASDSSGSLFLLSLTSRNLLPILRRQGSCPDFVEHSPAFSPRGNEIAYVTGEPSEHIRAVPAAGVTRQCTGPFDAPFHPAERAITEASPLAEASRFVSAPRWSPDGRRLLYVERLGPRPGFPYGGPDRIYVVPSTAGTRRLIAEGTDPTWVGTQKIAYVSPVARAGGGHVMIVKASGGRPEVVRRAARTGCCSFRYLDWSPRAR